MMRKRDMKTVAALFFLIFSIGVVAQVPTYKWVSGTETSTPTNLVLTGPGPRTGTSSFLDDDGNFWVYGGYGTDASTFQGYLNDLWKYDRDNGDWTWVDGLMTTDKQVPTYNNALTFDGVKVVLNEEPISYHDPFTIEIWFKAVSDGPLISFSPPDPNDINNGWSLDINGGNRLQIRKYYSAVQVEFITDLLIDNQWHHVAFSYTGEDHPDGDKITMYVDGALVGERNVFFSYDFDPDGDHVTMFGGSQGFVEFGEESYFNGQIDEIRFWNDERTAGEIKSNYAIELAGEQDGLIAYFPFNQGEANSNGNFETFVYDVEGGILGELTGDIYRPGVFIGDMAKMRVWDYGLTQGEILSAASSTVSFGDPGLAMAFTFDDGVAGADNTGVTGVADVTTVNNGGLNNFTLNGTTSNFGEDNFPLFPTQYIIGSNESGVVTADMNNDTYDDVITADLDDTSISIWINDQTGGLETEFTVLHDVGSTPRDFNVGYFNNDAFPDIAVAAWGTNPGDDRVRIFFGDGNGGFASSTDLTFPQDAQPNQVRIADFNQDGEDDVVVLLAGEDRIEVHYGDGVGSFPTSASFDLYFPVYFKEAFTIADLNNDAYPDIAISIRDPQSGCAEVATMINDQTGGFPATNLFPGNFGGCLWADEIRVTDFNNDGIKDLVFFEEDYFVSLIGVGDGTFAENSQRYSFTGDYFTDIELTDINSDGIDDIIGISYYYTSIYLGDENGEFVLADRIVGDNNGPVEIALSDLDKNSFLDIVYTNQTNILSVVYREDVLLVENVPSSTLNFDGVDDYVDIPNLKIFDNSFTIEGWIKTEDNGPIFSFTESDPLLQWGPGQFSFAIKYGSPTLMVNGQDDIIGYVYVADGNWHHIAIVVEVVNSGSGCIGIECNETVRMYVDGSEVWYESNYDFDDLIDNANSNYFAKLGYASFNFRDNLGSTSLSEKNNWVEGVSFPENNRGRAYSAEWSDGESLYVFGGQGEYGIYNTLYSRKVITECPLYDGSSYSFNSTNVIVYDSPYPDIPGNGIMTESNTDQYQFTDFTFGVYEYAFAVGNSVGPDLINICGNPSIIGVDQYGFDYTISGVTVSPDRTELTLSWSTEIISATTTITLDAGLWPENIEWELLSGINTPGDPGNYGVKNVSDPGNLPPARFGVSAAIDLNDEAWIFGGAANDPASQFFNDLWNYDPILNEWVWVSGGSAFNELPDYGSKGVSAPTNVPGARSNNAIWTDAQGSIWIFGGFGYDTNGDLGILNDLWKFDTQTLEWTWVNGSDLVDQAGVYGTVDVYDASNIPGARTAALKWVDSNGIVWIFGGNGVDKFGISAGYLNDLWSYDPTINQWAWHSGSDFAGSTGSYNQTGLSSTEYVPGSRWHSAGWIDETDKLWLFSGYKWNQLSTSLYNDFWSYVPETKEWTWLSGFNSTANVDEQGVYGDEGTGTKPHPGGRNGGLAWTDLEGNFWMLGGEEFNANDGFFNDLWKYDRRKSSWEYINGETDQILNEGFYGSKGIGNAENEPRSRWHGASWTGLDGKLWFFGGINWNDPINDIGWLNDLWFYDPELNVYTWMGGSSTINATGVYGIKGEASTSHIPGARSSSSYWTDHDGNLWLFGGYESFEFNNDLWKFNPTTLEWTWVSGNNFQNSPGVYGELGVPDPTNSIGARRYTDGRIDQDGIVWVFGGDGHDINALRGQLNDLWKYDPATNIWTWVAGSQNRHTPGVFGTKGVAHPDNLPPPRYGHSTWIDDTGDVWIFGGYGRLDDGGVLINTTLNDLWKFDVDENMWTWVGGSDQFVPDGEYGIQGEFSEFNVISSRQRQQTFETTDKSLWFFGGRQGPIRNDFWEIKFTPGTAEVDLPSAIQQNDFTFSYDEAWSRSFQVQVANSNDFSDIFYDVESDQKEVTIPSLSPGSIYYYRVNAINEIGQSGFGPVETILTLPATPTYESLNLAVADLTSTSMNLEWQMTPGILDGYYIDISEDPNFSDASMVHADFDAKPIAVGQQQAVADLTPGTRYYARLQSYNASGVSQYSLTVPFLTKPATPTFDPAIVVSEATQSSAVVTWNEVPEILSGYRITVSGLDDGFVDDTAFLTDYNSRDIPKDRTSIPVNGLAFGTQYYAYLKAVNESGESDPSEKITILTTPASPVFALEGSILSISQTDVTFTWQAPEGFYEGYLLEVSTDFSFGNANLMLDGYGQGGTPKNIADSELEESVSGLVPGQTYFARIRSYNSSGESPNSNIISFTTIPRAPVFNDPSNISQNAASLSWSAPNGADLYLLDVNTNMDFGPTTQLFSEFPLAVTFDVLSDLEPGIRYYARVQSSNASGKSGDVNPADYNNTTFITIPATPALNDLENFTQSSVTISWPPVEGADDYLVDASDNFFQTFLNGFNSVPVAASSVEVTGLTPGVTYQVRVRSRNESGTSPNIGVFDIETLPETPIARDASNVSTSVFTANWDPADGAESYELEVSLDDFVTFHYNETLTASNPVQMTGLQAGSVYKYRVRAVNQSGKSPYSSEISVVAQNNAQSLSISNLLFEENFDEGTSSTNVSVSLSGGLGDAIVTWRHRKILSPTWSDFIEASGSGSSYSFDVTDAMLDDIGVEFEVYANDGITFVENKGNKIKRSFSESESSEIPSLVFSEWQMIAIPYVLEDDLVTSIFNELGSQEYKKGWRLMHYQDGIYQDAITGFTRIELGKGYWFNALQETTIKVGAGQANSDVPTVLSLSEGWNQIGNPFNSSVDWNQVKNDNNAFSLVDDLVIYNIDRKDFELNNELTPFTGAFVWANQDIEALEITPSSASGRTAIPAPQSALEGPNWLLPLTLNMNGRSKDIAGVGMNIEANLMKDQFDRLVPPRFESYLEMYTTRQEYFYPYFATDVVDVQNEYVWNFDLSSNNSSGLAVLEWDNSPFLGQIAGIWLVDERTGRIIEMTKQNSYSFNFSGQHNFSIHYSLDPNYEVLPGNLSLGDAYPNPAGNFTNIPVLLPERDQPYGLELSVFDIQGRKVTTITKGLFEGGVYSFDWNVEMTPEIKNGIYIYTLSFDDPTIKPRHKKILIHKP
jgi:N-acetylneuraminic acid mutarotase